MKTAKIWEESIVIPTYEIGEADKNPMFLESRVYQGSSGKIYPYPTVEKISDTRVDKTYQAVWLENEYLKVMVLPELGGRIQRAYDKTNQYDFVYYNHVIKPALVGLCGPWISGGIEFNWPQHHRPTTYSPVDHMLMENEDGSVTCRVCDVDQMYGTKGEASFTLYPGKAYIEIRGQLYNLPLVGESGGSGQRSYPVGLPAGCPCGDGSWQAGCVPFPDRDRGVLQVRLQRRGGYFPV